MPTYHVMTQDTLGLGNTVRVTPASHKAISWHSHSFYELVLVLEGFCMHHLGNSVFLAMEGDLLVIKPGVAHCYTGTKECRIINCLFLKEAFEEAVYDELMSLPGMPQILADDTDDFPHMHLDMIERKKLQKQLERMITECDEEATGWRLKIRSQLCSMLVECSRIYEAHEGKQTDKDLYSGHITQALSYIDEHYHEDTLTVQEVGEHVGVTADYLSRQFRKVTGIAVKEYIRRYRLSRAVTYLQQGFSVGETASKSGFHSISYFSREFKKEMGIPPSQYE